MLKNPLPRSEDLLHCVLEALTPNRLPLTIAIDGADGCGKSSLASWLAWQLGAATLYLDIYVIKDSNPITWRVDDLERAISARLKIGPVIVEGVLVLDALDLLARKPDFLVFVNGNGSHRLASRIKDYRARQRPRERAGFARCSGRWPNCLAVAPRRSGRAAQLHVPLSLARALHRCKTYYGPMLKALAALDEDSGRGPRSEKETQETRPLIRALSIVGHHRKG